jgi:hypothetical protein
MIGGWNLFVRQPGDALPPARISAAEEIFSD